MNNILCWSCKIKPLWWQCAYFTRFIIKFSFFPPLLPGVNVNCKVLKALGEGETRGMSVSSFKLLSSFLHPTSLFLSTGLCQLWKLKENPFPEGQYCLSWSFKQIFYTSLSWVIRVGGFMGERRRKVYILEQEIKIEINQEMFNFCSHLPDVNLFHNSFILCFKSGMHN